MAEESYVAFAGDGVSESGVEADDRIHYAEAVGADEAHAAALEIFLDLAFEGYAFFAAFFEAGGDHHDGADTGLATFVNYAGNCGSGRDDYGEIDFAGNFADGGECLQAENFGALGIDGNDLAFEVAIGEIGENGAADAAFAIGGADDGDARGLEDGVEGAGLDGGAGGGESFGFRNRVHVGHGNTIGGSGHGFKSSVA